jgi:hypothetical protein
MRKELARKEGSRETFTGAFVRFGFKSAYRGRDKPTLLLRDVKQADGKIVTDHLWFNLTKEFERAGLSEDDVVQFDARVKRYEKGYKGWRDDVYDRPISTDYKLSHPTKVKVVQRSNDDIDKPPWKLP